MSKWLEHILAKIMSILWVFIFFFGSVAIFMFLVKWIMTLIGVI